MSGAANGAADSFTELCRGYYPAMVAIAHSIIGDRHLAEDAAQQAFARAARKIGQLKKKSRFAAWMAAICRNEARDVARKNERSACDRELSGAAIDECEGDAEREAVKEAIRRLSAKEREVIFLRFYDGLSYEKISAVLGISGEAVNGRLRRAKKSIAGILRREGFGEVKL